MDYDKIVDTIIATPAEKMAGDYGMLKNLPNILDLSESQDKKINADYENFQLQVDALAGSLWDATQGNLSAQKLEENTKILKDLADKGYPNAQYRYAQLLDSQRKTKEADYYWGLAANNDSAGPMLKDKIKTEDETRGNGYPVNQNKLDVSVSHSTLKDTLKKLDAKASDIISNVQVVGHRNETQQKKLDKEAFKREMLREMGLKKGMGL